MAVDLDAIKARISRAKSGPWLLADPTTGEIYAGDVHDWDSPNWKYVGTVNDDADADLIAHAPTDLATLVGEVERLRARDVLTTAVTEAADSYTKAESDPGVLEVHRAKAYKRLCIALDALNAGGA